jgi:hypothetical protein
MFPEALLHYVWKFRLFDHHNLRTNNGEKIEILHGGFHNRNSGPDFSEARIRIADKLWIGQVEIHLSASDWHKHRHDGDAAYDNVILHVVYEKDCELFRKDGSKIPTLSLKNRISEDIIQKSLNLFNSPESIPCAKHFSEVPELTVHMWLERLAVERLQYKTEFIKRELEQSRYNWEQIFYLFLARNFGTPVNTEPFELLARSLPIRIISKHKDNLTQIEALLFGQAGLLETSFSDSYPKILQNEYRFLQNKYGLMPMLASAWKFGRMRPAAFPSIRIALFAQLINKSNHLFSTLLETIDLPEIKKAFALKVSDYWLEHYRFEDNTQKRQQKSLGEAAIQSIVINTLVPFLFHYGKMMQREDLIDRALLWLEQTEAEENSIIRIWKNLGLRIENAHQTQALIHLKRHYCEPKSCLECAVGNQIMR